MTKHAQKESQNDVAPSRDDHDHQPPAPLAHALTRLRALRAERAARARLHRELATYDTPAEIADLLAAVDRAEELPGAGEVRRILNRNLQDYYRSTTQRLAG
ncbi:MAG TPA: hypothetical protein PLP61_16635 [Nocardioides sp.]|uniref:hypothetical protein n=1 Tax=Nocardioides sp. TaxID=35761 RepID=UPI002CBFFE98|nr:hypothetical protein [Nocardioides sp.]HQR28673.1 hypothetical protein [Nocardioides sp.]